MPYSVNDNWKDTMEAIERAIGSLVAALTPLEAEVYLLETDPAEMYADYAMGVEGGEPFFTLHELERFLRERT